MADFKRILQVAEPVLNGNERRYVLDCIDSGWVSSAGQYVEKFETAFAEFCGVRHALSCSNGTVALHLALLALDIGPGDEVIVPAMTFVATANAVTYCGARPVFADSDPDSWNLDPAHVEALVTPQTRAIVAVHLFGLPADMDALRVIAQRHGLALVEDAAEAHGARHRERVAGSLADVGTFSFYGNKILTTGEGGMVTTDDDAIAERVKLLKGQGLAEPGRYWHAVVGYNYRMTNMAAALGLGQLENAGWHLKRRREVARTYRGLLQGEGRIRFQAEPEGMRHAHWMSSVVIEEAGAEARDRVLACLREQGVETRPFFVPMHCLPMYAKGQRSPLPVAERLGDTGFSLPSGAGLERADQERVVGALRQALESMDGGT